MTVGVNEWPAVNSNFVLEALLCDGCPMQGSYPEWFKGNEFANRKDNLLVAGENVDVYWVKDDDYIRLDAETRKMFV